MKMCYLSILFLFANISCTSVSAVLKGEPLYILGSAEDAEDIFLFDGHESKGFVLSDGEFRIPHSVSKRYYGVIFITRDGFYPESIIFRSEEKPLIIGKIHLKKLDEPEKGILTGVVYTPVTGGKIVEHIGISRLHGNININIVKDPIKYTVKTDARGVFMISLPEGEYNIGLDGQDTAVTIISPGKTTIKNMQKGLVLID